ncbi:MULTISPECIES: phage holin family protein [unclassified Actinomyces]|uniref:phage holin family protein n=1 Tax=unclassified Actinomyces TaxID=2609248 RepID=UPI002016DDED|nr:MULTISPECIES: phage holin family protein [unclassified Actinomyces]MCL3777300.1 phage holin family protein [Actinomyces sp. AC-20-1]MCL3789567.1 phage holin family protein [Actinomyces sp. 187325]MCL3791852.1 phage holin family protein [Actinomyces sp. 186855]MCL3793662.1 phage holin family protein [Actinomyces sp. 217892]
MDLIARTIGNAAGLWLAASLLSGIWITGGSSTTDTVLIYLLVGLVLALVNSVVKPVAKVIAFPLYVLTFGLFALVVNGAMLMLTSAISQTTSAGLVVSSFGTAVLGSLIVSVISAVVVGLIGPRQKD